MKGSFVKCDSFLLSAVTKTIRIDYVCAELLVLKRAFFGSIPFHYKNSGESIEESSQPPGYQ